MQKTRLEAFSDGVIAVIITIMVLELEVPHGTDLGALATALPVFLAYVLSFVFVGIYWNNHHHLLHAVQRVDGAVLWANMHLLFWLSLVPFVTAWMSENDFAPIPVALYGVVLLLAAVAYYVLVRVLVARHGKDSILAHALGSNGKALISILAYVTAIGLSLWNGWLACAMYALIAVAWFVPDSRIERYVEARPAS
jgi:uncharacterized membrane protein